MICIGAEGAKTQKKHVKIGAKGDNTLDKNYTHWCGSAEKCFQIGAEGAECPENT